MQSAPTSLRSERGARGDLAKVLVDSLKTTLGSGARHIEQSATAVFLFHSLQPAGLKPGSSVFLSFRVLELNIKCSKGGGAKLEGPSPGTAKWRSGEVGEKKREEKKKENHRRAQKGTRSRSGFGRWGWRRGPGVRG